MFDEIALIAQPLHIISGVIRTRKFRIIMYNIELFAIKLLFQIFNHDIDILTINNTIHTTNEANFSDTEF